MGLKEIQKITQIKFENTSFINKARKYNETAKRLIDILPTLLYNDTWKMFLLYDDDAGYYKTYDDDKMASTLFHILDSWTSFDVDICSSFLIELTKTLIKALPKHRHISEHEVEHNQIAFKNIMLNTSTMETQAHTPKVLCYMYIDHKYIEDRKAWVTKAPVFLKYLASTFVTPDDGKADISLIKLVQELMGGLFYAHKSANMSIYCLGDGDNGKSVFSEAILEQIFPEEFVSAASLELLTIDKFGCAELFKKRINITSEDESDKVKSGKFKNIVTGETMSAQEKYGKVFKFRNYAKLFFTSNISPQFLSFPKPMRKRIRVIPFNADFSIGSKNRIAGLEEMLKKEIPYIISFFLEGLERLRDNKFEFTENAQVSALLNGLRDNSNGVSYFVANFCDITKECLCSASDLYGSYKDAIDSLGFGKTSIQKFGRQLLEYDGVKKNQSNKSFYNLKLKEEVVEAELNTEKEADKLFN